VTRLAARRLGERTDAIEESSENQRSSEGYALVKYNAESLRDRLPIPLEPTVTPTRPPRP
jgi:hypothetical protein